MRARLLLARLAREGLWTAALLAGASLLVFLVVRAAPGDAAVALGLAEAPVARGGFLADYARWIAGALQGDLGVSLRTGRPVADEIRRAGPNTLALTLGALAVTVAVAVPVGVAGALRRGSPLAAASTVAAYALSALPAFFVGYVVIYLFTRRLAIFPLAFGGDRQLPWLAFVLPVLVLGIANGAVGEVIRHVRGALERVLAEEYIRTARAKGAPVWRHAAAEGLVLPLASVLAAKVPFVLGGAVVVEQVFNWPGLGRLAWQAALDRDYPVIMGLALLAAVAARGAMLLAALAQAALAPGARPGAEIDRPLAA
ncbi:MAG TPA: ABC transporter permease, partial [Thermodesulfobacteriota bacterium]|nr:ABC transporter permease [Thermodesulfobacteriota bacterium]